MSKAASVGGHFHSGLGNESVNQHRYTHLRVTEKMPSAEAHSAQAVYWRGFRGVRYAANEPAVPPIVPEPFRQCHVPITGWGLTGPAF